MLRCLFDLVSLIVCPVDNEIFLACVCSFFVFGVNFSSNISSILQKFAWFRKQAEKYLDTLCGVEIA
jgi:hypothetical protein